MLPLSYVRSGARWWACWRSLMPSLSCARSGARWWACRPPGLPHSSACARSVGCCCCDVQYASCRKAAIALWPSISYLSSLHWVGMVGRYVMLSRPFAPSTASTCGCFSKNCLRPWSVLLR